MPSAYYLALECGLYGQLRIAESRDDRIDILNHSIPIGAHAEAFAFAPSACVAHFRIALTHTSEAEAAETARDMLKDKPDWPSGGVHLVLGPRQKHDPRRDVYVLRAVQMQTWLDQLAHAGLPRAKIIPEQCLLNEGETALLVSHSKAGDEVPGSQPDAEQASARPRGRAIEDDIGLIRLAERMKTRHVINLRTGHFAPEEPKQENYARWRIAAGVAIAAASVWTGNLILEARNYEYSTGQAEARSAELYDRLFSDTPVDIAPGTANDTFNIMSAGLSRLTQELPGFAIAAMRFETQRMTTRIRIPADYPVSHLLAELEKEGVSIRIEAVHPGEDGYEVELIMEQRG